MVWYLFRGLLNPIFLMLVFSDKGIGSSALAQMRVGSTNSHFNWSLIVVYLILIYHLSIDSNSFRRLLRNIGKGLPDLEIFIVIQT
jgi:hypothetical protein